MIGKETKGERPISISEVRQMLEKRQEEVEEDEELRYEQKVTLDYAQKFGEKDVERVKKAIEELKELDIEEEDAVNIVNLMPFNKDQINLVFEKKRYGLEDEEIEKALKIIDDLRENE